MRVKRLDPRAKFPTRHYDALGYDLYALEDVVVPAVDENGGIGMTKVRTGIAVELPPMWGALIKDRSSVATKRRLVVVAGVIDPDYRGEIIVCLENHSGRVQTIKAGEKIAQLIPIPMLGTPVIESDELTETTRGKGGFGSSDAHYKCLDCGHDWYPFAGWNGRCPKCGSLEFQNINEGG